MSLGVYRRAAAAFVALGVIGGPAAAPALAADPPPPAHWSPLGISAAADCGSPAPNVLSVPWSLQRVVLDQLWRGDQKADNDAARKSINGAGVTVAVIDTGVDNVNPQLAGKVEAGESLLMDKSQGGNGKKVDGPSTADTVGHGTKVAGIIAAKRSPATGFVGLAPEAKIFAIRQNDAQGNGDVGTLIQAIRIAIDKHVDVINISQDVRADNERGDFDKKDDLKKILVEAENAKIVVVASSGNDGHEGDTFPAAFETVLSVGASDRNNERASFSEYGDFVKVAAPGVDMLSTVPTTGQCVDNGTSFSAPYVSGVAALLKQRYPNWTANQIRTRIEQTAQRTEHASNKFLGWGVVDPVKAVQSNLPPAEEPKSDPELKLATAPLVAQPLGLAETQDDRDRRTGTYVLGAGGLLVAGLAGGAVVMRDRRRRLDS